MSHRPNQEESYALWQEYNPRGGDWLDTQKDLILRFLKDAFYQMPRDGGTDNRLYHYDPDETKSDLVISEGSRIDSATVEKRPAIVISRGPFAYGNVALDQLLSLEPQTAKRTHTDMVTGSFRINCIARAEVEADRIAVIVARMIRYYRRELQKAGFFMIGNQVQVGEASPPGALVDGEPNEDFINSPVYIPVHYQDSWTAVRQATLLQSLSLKVQNVFTVGNGQPFYPDSYNEDGTLNESSDGVTISAWTVPSD